MKKPSSSTQTTTKSNLLFSKNNTIVGLIRRSIQIQILILLLSFPSSFSTKELSSLTFVRSRFYKTQQGHHLLLPSFTRDWNIHLEKIDRRRNYYHKRNSNKMTSVLRQRKNVDTLNSIRGGGDDVGDAGGNYTNGSNNINMTSTHTTSTTNVTAPVTTTTATTVQEESKPLLEESRSTTASSSSYKPSKVRSAVFPIYGKEVNKFILMGSIKFFVIMALTLTRDTKDTLVVTQCGAEAIAFLKV